ncbi:unnamed protein product, partial [Nesidiocoris tenuis]
MSRVLGLNIRFKQSGDLAKIPFDRFLEKYGLFTFGNEDFRHLRRYMKAGVLPERGQVTFELMSGAWRSQQIYLAHYCERVLLLELNADNFVNYVIKSETCASWEFKAVLVDYFAAKGVDVIQSTEWTSRRRKMPKLLRSMLDEVRKKTQQYLPESAQRERNSSKNRK